MTRENDESGVGAEATLLNLVGDETRLSILAELARDRRDGGEEGLAFATLRRRVGLRDSANFNYHLGKLTGPLVEQVDERYRLTPCGVAVVVPLLAGAYATHEREPEALETDCQFCGRGLEALYRDGRLVVTCGNDHRFTVALPPGTVAERPLEDLLAIAALRMQTEARHVAAGVCCHCYGTVDLSLESDPGHVDLPYLYRGRCNRCGEPYATPPRLLAIFDPGTVAFARDRGVDPSARPPWTLADIDHDVGPHGGDRGRLCVTVSVVGDDRTVVLDERGRRVESP